MERLIIKMVIYGGIDLENIIKFYSFTEENKHVKNFSVFFENIFILFFPIIVYCILRTLLEKIIGYNIINSNTNKIFIFVLFICGIVCLIIYNKSIKGICLYNDYLQINTNFLLKRYIFTINPKIKYNEIREIALKSKKSQTYDEWNEKHIYFIAGYYSEIDCYIRLETVYDKKYCFCIEKPYEFLEEIDIRTDDNCLVIDDTK